VRPELEIRLYRTWVEIFRGVVGPTSGSLRAFGCEHRDGWFTLVDVLCEVLTKRAESLGRNPPEAVQIKEKFGGLRFYVRGTGEPYSDGAIQCAGRLSFRICEISGGPGRLCRKGGRVATLSPSIAAANQYEMIPDDVTRLPPLSIEEAASSLKTRWPRLLRCQPQIAGGWLDIADVTLGLISSRTRIEEEREAYVEELREKAGKPIIRVATDSPENCGVIAMALAMARRIDPETGEPYRES
jgi:hypothetical protein